MSRVDQKFAGGLVETSIIGQSPQQNMSIEKQAHALVFALERIKNMQRERSVKIFLDFDLAA